MKKTFNMGLVVVLAWWFSQLQAADCGVDLIIAACTGQSQEVAALIAAGQDVNYHNVRGETALMAAAAAGHTEIMLTLLKAGAKINMDDIFGETALMKAVTYQQLDAVRLLLTRLAAVNVQSKGHLKTALMIAADRGNKVVVMTLLAAHADVMLKNWQRQRASAIALARGHGDVALILQQAERLSSDNKARGLVA